MARDANEAMIAKIAAILAKAKSTTHEGEALVLMAKAEELMQAHGIDLIALETPDDPIEADLYAFTAVSEWQLTLAGQVGAYYGCKIVGTDRAPKDPGGCVHIVGKASGRAMVKHMWPYLVRCCGREATLARRAGELDLTQEQARKQIGFALCVRLARLVAARQPPEPKVGSTGTSLVLADEVQAKMDQVFGAMKADAREKRLMIEHAAQRRAEAIPLNDQVSGARRSDHLQLR